VRGNHPGRRPRLRSRPGMWCKEGVPRRLCCWVLF